MPGRQIPAQVPTLTPPSATSLQAGPIPWPGTLGTGSDGLRASTQHTQVCPVSTEPALLQAQPRGAEQHLAVDQLPFCINIPVRQMHTAIMPISDRKEGRLRLRKAALWGRQSEREGQVRICLCLRPPLSLLCHQLLESLLFHHALAYHHSGSPTARPGPSWLPSVLWVNSPRSPWPVKQPAHSRPSRDPDSHPRGLEP